MTPSLNTRPCEGCSAPLVRPPRISTASWMRRKFCDRRCVGLRPRPTAICGHCQTTFPLKHGRRPAKFCSTRCMGLAKRGTPRYRKIGDKLEHRAVMEEVLGRPLKSFETVHHKNGRRLENVPGNLELWVTPQPAGQRVEDLVDWVVEHYPGEIATRLAARSAGAAELVRRMGLSR